MRLSSTLLVSGALLAACRPPATDEGEDTGSPPADCVDEALTVDVSLGEVATVVHVAWESAEPIEARVVYTDAEGVELATPAGESATSGVVNVLGLLPNREVTVWVEGTVAGQPRCSEPVTITTGSLPSGLPELEVTVNAAERDVRGWHTLAVFRESDRYAAILDADGRFVWAWRVEAIYRATLSRDRDVMLANEPAPVWNGAGRLLRIPIAGGEPEVIQVTGAHTDFVELPDGTLATLGWTRRAFEDETRHLLGDTIVEVAPDGTQTVVWDIFDHIEPYLDTTYAESPVSGEDEPFLEEWSHVNSINYDEASDDYLITGSFNHAVMRIDRSTGALVWTLTDSTSASDWVVQSDERELELPHSSQLLDDGAVLAFSRGPLGAPENPAPCAWVTELALDDASGVATPRWHYTGDDCLTVPFLGQARRVDAGNTVVLWSPAGRLSQTGADATTVFQVDLELGSAIGFGEWSASLY